MSTSFPRLDASGALKPIDATGRPIYHQEGDEYAIFYAPGCLCVVSLQAADEFVSTLSRPHSPTNDWSGELERHAEHALAQSAHWEKEPFQPECLTLYMNNECNLDCVYCHTAPSTTPTVRLEPEPITAAALMVAQSCRQKGCPLYAVFHGGGEPTLHRERVDEAMARLETIALKHDVQLFRYVATNGIMSESKARWLAHCFDLVGLSCDGPADIQDRQRPLVGGGSSSKIVERTAHILREEGQDPIRVDWRLASVEDGFKVVDVVVEGASMSATLRSEFASIIRQRGGKVAGLLEAMREKTAKLLQEASRE